MKGKFFGHFAKLAVAILAVGMSLTSCYDEEVGGKYTPTTPDVTYVVSGQVTDSQTFAPISGATVKCGSLSATTNASGNYELKSINTAITGTVTFNAEGYYETTATASTSESSPFQTINAVLKAYSHNPTPDTPHGDTPHGDTDHSHSHGNESAGGGEGGE